MGISNKYRKISVVACVALFMTFGNFYNNNTRAATYDGQVTTVTSNVLTNETTTVVGNSVLFGSGSSVNAADLTAFKTALSDAISACQDSVTINYTGSTAIGTGSLSTLLSNYVKDVMQTAGNDYEKHILYSWTFSYSGSLPSFTVTYNLSYLETQAQRDAVTSKVNTIISNIITNGMTDEQKEKAINDYIVSTVAYDTTLKDHTAYGALFGAQKTVCQGYALLAYKMLTTAGINNRIVTGTVGTTGHAWNLVSIGGKWYQLDTTWNDPVPDVVGRVRYDYFNLTDTQLAARKHQWTASFYPAATTPYIANDPAISAAITAGGGSLNVTTAAIDTSNVSITNNIAGKTDSISINGLTSGQIVKIYKNIDDTKPFLTKTIPSTTTGAAFTVSQLGVSAGSLYVTLTGINAFESSKTKVDYSGEPKTSTPTGIAVVNNVDPSYKDIITVTGLNPKDIVKVYTDTTLKTLMGTATVTPGGVAVNVNLAATKLTAAGSVYVTVKSPNYLESNPGIATYSSEIQTATPSAVEAYNYTDISDVIQLTGVKEGDTVKVYDASSAGKVLVTGKVKKGRTSLALNVRQLGTGTGSVWVSVKSINERESDRAKVDYLAEQ